MKRFIYIFLIFISCQEEITLDLAQVNDKLVVEGIIEPGFPPYVILTKNQGYFAQIDTTTYSNLFVTDAVVTVSYIENGVNYPKNLKPYLSDSLVIYSVNEQEYNFINGSNNYDFSKIGRTYLLEIVWNGDTITSTTSIPEPTPLDSIWVDRSEYYDYTFESDIKAWYTDPPEANFILIKSKRIKYFEQDSVTCDKEEKNEPFLKLLDCASDILVNGEGFETFFPRPDDNGFPTGNYNAAHYQKCNSGDSIFINEDVVLIKFCQIDEVSMKFWRGVIRQAGFNSNPFTEPLNLPSNVNGGLGVWTGLSPVYYKVPIVQDTTIFIQYQGLKFIDIL